MKESLVGQKAFSFALSIIELYRRLQDQREFVISKQLLRCGTSIGANVEEATAGQSRADFLSKMSIASKKARETRYSLRLLEASHMADVDVSNELVHVEELIRLLTSIVKTTSETPQTTHNSKLKTQN